MQFKSMIVALVVVSESEIVKVFPDYEATWEMSTPYKFKEILYSFGLDVSLPYRRQDGLLHRNRLNEVTLCSRWVGESRLDPEWINSGYASKEAIDKFKNSRMLDDIYRMRGETEDMQERMESRDKYYEPELE